MKYFFLFLFFVFAACSGDDNADASDECKQYCADAETKCIGENEIYSDNDSCFETCALFIDAPPPNGEVVKAGNTLQCRVYHVSVAGSNPAVHCQHASITSTPDTCQSIQTPCNTYCGEYFETCEDEFAADFETLQNCLNKCPTDIPIAGEPMGNDTSDTVNCRISQISAKNCDGGKVESDVCKGEDETPVDPVE